MQQLFIRAVSGAVYAFIVLSASFTPPYGPVFLAIFLGSAAIMEWMAFTGNKQVSRPAGLMLGIFLLCVFLFSDRFEIDQKQNAFSYLTISLLIISLALTQAFTKKRDVPNALFHSFFGLIYITLPLCSLTQISFFMGGEEPWLLAGIFILIWSSDTFAYLVGKRFGKHKLLPSVSPNKTWEGFAGAVVATIVVSTLLGLYLETYPIWMWLGLGIVVIAFGSAGDLFESAMKRAYGLKDSGKFMPGHGGILDRIDSLLFALPMTHFYLIAVEYYLQ